MFRTGAALLCSFLAGHVAAQPRRLRIVNGCDRAPLWVAHINGLDPQNLLLEPGGQHDFLTADGLHSTRFWPKMGCDIHGDHCVLGGSGGPGQACVVNGDNYSACAPPIDTKFEASFGRHNVPCTQESQAGCDFIDMSLVDGWTLPFKLIMRGPWCSREDRAIDCSSLTMDKCPAQEQLDRAGLTADLRAVEPETDTAAGCYSPCSRLSMGKWGSSVLGPRSDPRVSPYCCPTPPVTPHACRAGPIGNTAFVRAVHEFCPGVYGYAYDDAAGLLQCHPTTHYELTFFCPSLSPPGLRRDLPAQEARLESPSGLSSLLGEGRVAVARLLGVVLLVGVAVGVGVAACCCGSEALGLPPNTRNLHRVGMRSLVEEEALKPATVYPMEYPHTAMAAAGQRQPQPVAPQRPDRQQSAGCCSIANCGARSSRQ